MTVTAENEILQKLRSRGCRMTRARREMILLLAGAEGPLDASEIKSSLRSRGLVPDRATIYRELNFLMANKIVRQMQLAGRAAHYEIASGHHHHLVCIKCNSVKMVVLGKHLERHERRIYQKENFKVVSHALEFYGLCRNCQG